MITSCLCAFWICLLPLSWTFAEPSISTFKWNMTKQLCGYKTIFSLVLCESVFGDRLPVRYRRCCLIKNMITYSRLSPPTPPLDTAQSLQGLCYFQQKQQKWLWRTTAKKRTVTHHQSLHHQVSRTLTIISFFFFSPTFIWSRNHLTNHKSTEGLLPGEFWLFRMSGWGTMERLTPLI